MLRIDSAKQSIITFITFILDLPRFWAGTVGL